MASEIKMDLNEKILKHSEYSLDLVQVLHPSVNAVLKCFCSSVHCIVNTPWAEPFYLTLMSSCFLSLTLSTMCFFFLTCGLLLASLNFRTLLHHWITMKTISLVPDKLVGQKMRLHRSNALLYANCCKHGWCYYILDEVESIIWWGVKWRGDILRCTLVPNCVMKAFSILLSRYFSWNEKLVVTCSLIRYLSSYAL